MPIGERLFCTEVTLPEFRLVASFMKRNARMFKWSSKTPPIA